MDVEEFFDQLYGHFCVHFPCYALYESGKGFVVEPANDGTASLVIFSDEDLLERHLLGLSGPKPLPVGFHDYVALARVLERLPRRVSHVTFDPHPKFHRRYPVPVIRESLTAPATDAPKA